LILIQGFSRGSIPLEYLVLYLIVEGFQGIPPDDKIVYRITYNVYRLNTVANLNVFQGFSRGSIPLEYLVGKTR
jgi:hypothetical protein